MTETERDLQDKLDKALAKLEQAERALEGADEKLAHISSKDFANGQLRYEAATIIQEALKAIRE